MDTFWTIHVDRQELMEDTKMLHFALLKIREVNKKLLPKVQMKRLNVASNCTASLEILTDLRKWREVADMHKFNVYLQCS